MQKYLIKFMFKSSLFKSCKKVHSEQKRHLSKRHYEKRKVERWQNYMGWVIKSILRFPSLAADVPELVKDGEWILMAFQIMWVEKKSSEKRE